MLPCAMSIAFPNNARQFSAGLRNERIVNENRYHHRCPTLMDLVNWNQFDLEPVLHPQPDCTCILLDCRRKLKNPEGTEQTQCEHANSTQEGPKN